MAKAADKAEKLVKVRKTHGQMNLQVYGMGWDVIFKDGMAEVTPEIADYLAGIPGYEAVKEAPKPEPKGETKPETNPKA